MLTGSKTTRTRELCSRHCESFRAIIFFKVSKNKVIVFNRIVITFPYY